MQELMAQQGAVRGARGQQNPEQQKANDDAKREAEERRQMMLSQILSSEARERLARIALVKPEKARGVEDVLLRAAQMGQIVEKSSPNVVVKPFHVLEEIISRGYVTDLDTGEVQELSFTRANGDAAGLRSVHRKALLEALAGTSQAKDPEDIQKEVLENYAKDLPPIFLDVVQHTDLSTLTWAPLMFRYPWNVVFGNLSKQNITVTGDAMHPMTPDLAQEVAQH
ncbi:hypothetical protein J5N97_000545 [Dioscorea zingiberensis]|uniref:Uncharacterized protein n=1 Tax=Dioscorea zingiberensis TaxID=325984 RepID=A0A9D5BS12_9LILI|nr:hypothetical protein J5N97_000545 [Dioscorea zingiberensis]